jgi:chemotaxis protein MotB
MTKFALLFAVTTAVGIGGLGACKTNGTYNKMVAELTAKDNADNDAAKKREADLQTQLDQLKKDSADLKTQLDAATAQVATLQDQLKTANGNLDTLTKANKDAASRLEELKKQKAAADARLAAFRSLIDKLHSMISNGQLKVVIRDGRMIIALPSDILFESGRTDVKPAGKTALAQVTKVLAQVPDRHFNVAGHTDDVPIKTPQFPSNWELSTARAVEVVHFMISQGMDPKRLAAAGYGEFDPVVANDSTEHRAQNRRIEIVLQPNLSDLPPMDDLMKENGTPTK